MTNKSRGFSMVELLVTMAVGVILLSMASMLQDTVRRNRLVDEYNELMASLRLARSEAFKRMQPVTVCPSADGVNCTANSQTWETGWIVFADANNNGKVDNGEVVFKAIGAMSAGFTVRSNANIAGSLQYQANGRTDRGNGYFVLCFSNALNKSKAIFLSNSGRVYQGVDTDSDGVPEGDQEFMAMNNNNANVPSCTPP